MKVQALFTLFWSGPDKLEDQSSRKKDGFEMQNLKLQHSMLKAVSCIFNTNSIEDCKFFKPTTENHLDCASTSRASYK